MMPSASSASSASQYARNRRPSEAVEPDPQWKANIKKQIEDTLTQLLHEAEQKHASDFNATASPEGRRGLQAEHQTTLYNLRRMAGEQYQDVVAAERDRRRLAASLGVTNPEWLGAVRDEQELILAQIKQQSAVSSSPVDDRTPPRPRFSTPAPHPRRPSSTVASSPPRPASAAPGAMSRALRPTPGLAWAVRPASTAPDGRTSDRGSTRQRAGSSSQASVSPPSRQQWRPTRGPSRSTSPGPDDEGGDDDIPAESFQPTNGISSASSSVQRKPSIAFSAISSSLSTASSAAGARSMQSVSASNYVCPIVLDDIWEGEATTVEGEDEAQALSFEQFKLMTRIAKINEFHTVARDKEVELVKNICKLRMNMGKDSFKESATKMKVKAGLVQHEKDMKELQLTKEAERQAIVEAERCRRVALVRDQRATTFKEQPPSIDGVFDSSSEGAASTSPPRHIRVNGQGDVWSGGWWKEPFVEHEELTRRGSSPATSSTAHNEKNNVCVEDVLDEDAAAPGETLPSAYPSIMEELTSPDRIQGGSEISSMSPPESGGHFFRDTGGDRDERRRSESPHLRMELRDGDGCLADDELDSSRDTHSNWGGRMDDVTEVTEEELESELDDDSPSEADTTSEREMADIRRAERMEREWGDKIQQENNAHEKRMREMEEQLRLKDEETKRLTDAVNQMKREQEEGRHIRFRDDTRTPVVDIPRSTSTSSLVRQASRESQPPPPPIQDESVRLREEQRLKEAERVQVAAYHAQKEWVKREQERKEQERRLSHSRQRSAGAQEDLIRRHMGKGPGHLTTGISLQRPNTASGGNVSSSPSYSTSTPRPYPTRSPSVVLVPPGSSSTSAQASGPAWKTWGSQQSGSRSSLLSGTATRPVPISAASRARSSSTTASYS